MPILRWTGTDVRPPSEVLMMASRLPLRRYRSVPGFLRATLVIRRQLARADGLIGYSLKADLLRKTFYTLSAWQDDASLNKFAEAQPHRDRVAAIRPGMHPTTFVTWKGPSGDLPVSWAEAHRRLDEVSPS